MSQFPCCKHERSTPGHCSTLAGAGPQPPKIKGEEVSNLHPSIYLRHNGDLDRYDLFDQSETCAALGERLFSRVIHQSKADFHSSSSPRGRSTWSVMHSEAQSLRGKERRGPGEKVQETRGSRTRACMRRRSPTSRATSRWPARPAREGRMWRICCSCAVDIENNGEYTCDAPDASSFTPPLSALSDSTKSSRALSLTFRGLSSYPCKYSTCRSP